MSLMVGVMTGVVGELMVGGTTGVAGKFPLEQWRQHCTFFIFIIIQHDQFEFIMKNLKYKCNEPHPA